MNGSSSHAWVAGLLAVALGGGCSVFTTPDVPLENPKRYQVSGTISGAVVAGVMVKLSGAESASATTDAQGKYSFGPVGNGLYSVAPALGGYVFQPPSTAVTVEGADVGGKDFVATATTVPTHRITGTVSGAVAAGVTIALSGPGNPSTVTDATGAFGFEGLVDGEYTLTPLDDGFGFDPAALPVTLSGADVAGADFTATALDRTPPKVVSQTPAPGDANVWVKAPIQVTFDEPIRLPPDSAVSVSGLGSAELAKTLSLSADGKTLTVALPSPPSAPNTITVTLGSGITDLAGNALVGTGWSFSMPVWWSPWPPLFSRDSYFYSAIEALAIDSSGAPFVAWANGDGIFVSHWENSQWRVLGSLPLVIVRALRLGSDDKPAIAYEQPSGSPVTYSSFAAKWNGSSWVSPSGEPLAQNQPAFSGSPSTEPQSTDLALSNSGQLYMLGSISTGVGNASILVKRWVSSSSSWAPVGGSLNQYGGFHKAIGMLNDSPIVAFIDSPTTWPWGKNVWAEAGYLYVSAWNGNAWSQLGGRTLSTSARPATSVALGVSRDQVPFVLWTDYDPQGADLSLQTAQVSYWSNGWTNLSTLELSSLTPSEHPFPSKPTSSPFAVFEGVQNDILVGSWNAASASIIGEALQEPGTLGSGLTFIEMAPDGTPVVAITETTRGLTIGTYDRSGILKRLNR